MSFWLGRRSLKKTVRLLEARVWRLQSEVNRRYVERLAPMQRRLGCLYLNGLPAASSTSITEGFEAGVRYAAQAAWDRALTRWSTLLPKAEKSEGIALQFLCAGCEVLLGRLEAAAGRLAAAFELASGDSRGAAACAFALGKIKLELQQKDDARERLATALALAETAGDKVLLAESSTLLAELEAERGLADRATELHRRALRIREELRDTAGAGRQYGAIGRLLAARGQLVAARAAYEDGLELARRARDRLGEANQLVAIGVLLSQQNERRRALEVLDRALALYEEIRNWHGAAAAAYEIGRVRESIGDDDSAIEYLERSLQFARQIHDEGLIALAESAIARGCARHGAYDRALELLYNSSRLHRLGGRTSAAASDLAVIARIRGQLHDVTEALNCLGQARQLFDEAGDRPGAIQCLIDEGELVMRSEPERALRCTEEALRLAHELGRRDLEAGALSVQARIQTALGELRAAAASYRTAIAIRAQLGDERSLVEDEVAYASVSRQLGDVTEAERCLGHALGRAQAAGDKLAQAEVLLATGEIHLAADRAAAARDVFRQALHLLMGTGRTDLEASALHGLGRALFETGETQEARRCLEVALKAYGRLGSREAMEEVSRTLSLIPAPEKGTVQIVDREADPGRD